MFLEFRKYVYRFVVIVILSIIVYGIIIPVTISMQNDFLATIGSLLVIIYPIAIIFYIIGFLFKILKTKKGDGNGK